MKIAVLYGGDSPEHDVSIRSGTYVAEALRTTGEDVELVDPSGMTQEAFVAAVRSFDMVFPMLHGKNGEDGTVQSWLEATGKPFLGSNSKVSKLAFNKHKVHDLLEEAGIRMPNFNVVSLGELDDPLFSGPFVLKPIEGGSSLDTIIARNPEPHHHEQAKQSLSKYDTKLLEELIDGQEITVGVLGDQALPPIAIIPPENGEFDYENKYNGRTQEIVPIPPDLVSETVQEAAKRVALQVYRLVGARHLSRVDMFITPEEGLVVLEINTIPGMTDESLFPKAAAAAGIDMVSLVKEFIRMVESNGEYA